MNETAGPGTFSFSSIALSDAGAIRTLNEDSFVVRDDIGLWAVADGVGGRDAGDVASRILVEALGGLGAPAGGKSYLEMVHAAIARANELMRNYVDETPSVASIASTVACLIAYRDHVACLWVGDSRIYRLRQERLDLLSKDHSLVQQLVDSGELTQAEARTHPRRNVITRAVGAEPSLEIATRRERLSPGDRFLLCSDGLSTELSDAEMGDRLGASDLPAAARALMDLALERGAKDNVTLIVIDAAAPSAS